MGRVLVTYSMTSSAKDTEYSVPFESQPLLFVAVTSYKSGRLTRYSPSAVVCDSRAAQRASAWRSASADVSVSSCSRSRSP